MTTIDHISRHYTNKRYRRYSAATYSRTRRSDRWLSRQRTHVTASIDAASVHSQTGLSTYRRNNTASDGSALT